ncbi:MAG: EpsG family protein, partial [Clostridia bacterium]|nr:EpsG family protein [Clostridia bacterium]
MLIYLFVDALILLFGFLTYKKTRKTWAVVLSLLLLVILAAIRGAFTSDYSNYLTYFLKVRRQVTLSEIFNPAVSFSMEKAFVLLSKLIGFLSDSPIVFFGIVSLLTLLAYWRGFLEFSPMPMLSILLFVSVGDYYAGYNLTRQILAAALVFFALTFWNKKQYLPFFVFLLVASSFHRTALILFPLAFLLNLRICKKNFFLL